MLSLQSAQEKSAHDEKASALSHVADNVTSAAALKEAEERAHMQIAALRKKFKENHVKILLALQAKKEQKEMEVCLCIYIRS